MSMNTIQVNLDVGTWQWLQVSVWVAVILTIGIIAVFAYHQIDQFRTPPFSKRVRDSHRSKKAGLLLAGDDGYGDYEVAKYTGSEGWVETPQRGKPKWNWIGFTPRPGKVDDAIPVDQDRDLSRTRTAAEYMNFLNTRKIVVRGSNNPLWIGVKSKAILANILAIAGVQITEELEKNWAKINIGLALSMPTFPIDVAAMKRMVVSSSYNASQVIALTKIHEQIGLEKRPAMEQMGKWVIILGIALVAAGACMLGAAAFLK